MSTMTRRTLPAYLTSLLLLCAMTGLTAGSAHAKEHRSSKGYSITYPDDWNVASEDMKAALADEVRRAAPGMAGSPAADSSGVDLMISHPVEDMFVENVNVTVSPALPRITADAARQVETLTLNQLAQAGFQTDGLKTTRETIGGRDVLSTRWVRRMPDGLGNELSLRQWQVLFPGPTRSYVITCSGAAADYAAVEPAFIAMVNSFKSDSAYPPGGGGAWESMSPIARKAIIGAVLGGLAGLVIAAVNSMRKRKAKSATGV